jgi:hypothetical protein
MLHLTADFHDQSMGSRLPQAAAVVNHATAFDAAVDGLKARTADDTPIRGFLSAP